jgi:cytoskeletal protein RodZ
MRVLIGLALVVLLLAVIGWVSFSHNGARTSINLETSQIKHDTSEMVDSGKNLLENAKTATSDRNRPVENGARPVATEPVNRPTNDAPAEIGQNPPPAAVPPQSDHSPDYDVTPPGERTATPSPVVPTPTR